MGAVDTTVVPWVEFEQINENLISYTMHHAGIQVFKAWQEAAINNLLHWPKDRPCLILHDISEPGVGLGYSVVAKNDIFNIGVLPESSSQVNEILAQFPDWQVCLALVVPSSLTSGRLSQRLLDGSAPGARVRARTFFKREAAIDWLNSLV